MIDEIGDSTAEYLLAMDVVEEEVGGREAVDGPKNKNIRVSMVVRFENMSVIWKSKNMNFDWSIFLQFWSFILYSRVPLEEHLNFLNWINIHLTLIYYAY